MLRIFHVSDPHIDNELVPPKRLFNGLAGHNIDVWGDFRRHILKRLEGAGDDYVVVLTGDVSARGEARSLDLAHQMFVLNPTSTVSEQVGLQIPPDKMIVIPGNHDSYAGRLTGRNSLRLYAATFAAKEVDPFPVLRLIQHGSTRAAVVGFDSTYLKLAWSLPKKLGRGFIEKEQYDKATGFLKSREVDVRIVCLHHNPIFPPNAARDWNLVLEGSRRFMGWIVQNEIDVVLFGHVHDDFYDLLPLKSLLELLPSRRGIRATYRRIFLGTNSLMDYKPITVKGRYVRQHDAIAYHYIAKQRSDLKRPDEHETKEAFEAYVRDLPEYGQFRASLAGLAAQKTALVMAGSVCQSNPDRKNSYLELEIATTPRRITVHRHKYVPGTGTFKTRSTEL